MWGNNYGGYQPGGQYSQQFGGQFGQMPQNYGQPLQTQQMPMRDDRLWVEGEEAARSYLVAAGSSAVLWDNNRDTIYFKQTDPTGRPMPMMILDFTVRDQNQKPDYVTRQEFQQFIASLMGQTAPAPVPVQNTVQNTVQQTTVQAPVQAVMPETEGSNG